MSGTISHSWNGTVLTVTSDSGTSSADLKGDTGIRGAQGAKGEQYKPKYGVDYFTTQEINSFMNQVEEYVDANAAPSGYGLGSISSDIKNVNKGDGDANNLTACGWYGFSSNTTNTPFPYGVMLVSNRLGVGATQLAFSHLNDGTHNNTMAIRRKDANGEDWKPWEYINPPMKLGVEYRTTERHNYQPVYVKAINFGNLPNAGHKNTDFATSVNLYPIQIYGRLSNGTAIASGYNYDRTSGGKFYLDNTTWSVRMLSENDCSSLTATIIIKYTKVQ